MGLWLNLDMSQFSCIGDIGKFGPVVTIIVPPPAVSGLSSAGLSQSLCRTVTILVRGFWTFPLPETCGRGHPIYGKLLQRP